jgi:DNA gyrase/topoisomerase IV subunit B
MSNLLTVRLEPDLHNKLRLATVTRGTTMAQVVREGLEAWLKSNPATGSAPARKVAKPAKEKAVKAKPAKAAKTVAKPAKKTAKPAKKGPKSGKVVAKPHATFPKPTAKARTMGGRARR